MPKKRELIRIKISEMFGKNSKQINSLVSASVGIQLAQHFSGEVIQSKVGGCPIAPSNFDWPNYEETPLTFLCQINLADLDGFNQGLPAKGVLYFFVAPVSYSSYSQLTEVIKIVYLKDVENFSEVQKADSTYIDEFNFDFFEHYTFPSYQEKKRLDLEIDDDLEELSEIISEITLGDPYAIAKHYLFGEPDAVQGSLRIYWGANELYPEDVYYENMATYLHQVETIGEDFVLLLQLNLEDERIKLPHYGDSCLYFGILKDDLKNEDFSKVRLVIQNT